MRSSREDQQCRIPFHKVLSAQEKDSDVVVIHKTGEGSQGRPLSGDDSWTARSNREEGSPAETGRKDISKEGQVIEPKTLLFLLSH